MKVTLEKENTAHKHKEDKAMTKRFFDTVREELKGMDMRSAWKRGVDAYAHELLDGLQEAVDGGWVELDDLASPDMLRMALLNGADNWMMYSEGGCSLICDQDIAKRLCTPSELRRCRHGEKTHNSRETWLDTQGRALYQASKRVKKAIATCLK